MVGYMITWTTYGSWLQGHEKGYVKNGAIYEKNERLKSANLRQQKYPSVKLNNKQKHIVEKAIIEEAKRINQKILAIAVCTNHVHLVAEVSKETIEQAVHRYKYSGTSALREFGVEGKIWSKGFDKRFCFNEKDLETKIRYVKAHIG